MAITCRTTVMDWQLSKESVLDRMEVLLKTSQWSDCTFRVEGENDVQVFEAHRLLLSAASPVFEAMCFGPLAEKSCIVISDLEPAVFKILLEYVYTDAVRLRSCEEAAGALYAAHKYMLPALAAACRDHLAQQLRPSNAIAIFDFAERMRERLLQEQCVKASDVPAAAGGAAGGARVGGGAEGAGGAGGAQHERGGAVGGGASLGAPTRAGGGRRRRGGCRAARAGGRGAAAALAPSGVAGRRLRGGAAERAVLRARGARPQGRPTPHAGGGLAAAAAAAPRGAAPVPAREPPPWPLRRAPAARLRSPRPVLLRASLPQDGGDGDWGRAPAGQRARHPERGGERRAGVHAAGAPRPGRQAASAPAAAAPGGDAGRRRARPPQVQRGPAGVGGGRGRERAVAHAVPRRRRVQHAGDGGAERGGAHARGRGVRLPVRAALAVDVARAPARPRPRALRVPGGIHGANGTHQGHRVQVLRPRGRRRHGLLREEVGHGVRGRPRLLSLGGPRGLQETESDLCSKACGVQEEGIIFILSYPRQNATAGLTLPLYTRIECIAAVYHDIYVFTSRIGLRRCL